jgi:hypothetical protein
VAAAAAATTTKHWFWICSFIARTLPYGRGSDALSEPRP